jgi:predicted small secreted protein
MVLLAVLLASAALLTGGCNMIKGFGKDIHDSTQNVQEWIEGGSQNSDYIAPG